MSNSGLGSKAASTLGVTLDYLGARFQLFLIEAKEARNGVIQKVALFVIGGFFLLLAWLGICVAGVGLLVMKLGWLWPWAALAVAGGHLVVGILALLLAKRKLSGAAFEDSIRELARDREWLNSHRDAETTNDSTHR